MGKFGFLGRSGFGKQISDVTLEGSSFHDSFLNHSSERETPKKMKQRMIFKREHNMPGGGVGDSFAPKRHMDEWSVSGVTESTTASPAPTRVRFGRPVVQAFQEEAAPVQERRRPQKAPIFGGRPSSQAGVRPANGSRPNSQAGARPMRMGKGLREHQLQQHEQNETAEIQKILSAISRCESSPASFGLKLVKDDSTRRRSRPVRPAMKAWGEPGGYDL